MVPHCWYSTSGGSSGRNSCHKVCEYRVSANCASESSITTMCPLLTTQVRPPPPTLHDVHNDYVPHCSTGCASSDDVMVNHGNAHAALHTFVGATGAHDAGAYNHHV